MIGRKEQSAILLMAVVFATSAPLARDRCVIVGFRDQVGASERDIVRDVCGVVARSYSTIPAVAAVVPEDAIEELRVHDGVLFVEESAVYRSAGNPASPEEYGESWGTLRIGADVAHRNGELGAGVRVAILDTGIDHGHEDLNENYAGGRDFVFGDHDPFDDSFNSHGTHIAGIIAAEANGEGCVGVAPNAEVLAVKVLDGAGFGTEDWIIAGIEWAVANEADVICMSLQGPDRQGLRAACEAARAAGVLLVAAAGNDLGGGGGVEFPAGYDSVVAVTATRPSDAPADFAPVGDELDIAAPGVDVLSTVAGGGYGFASGTSQAAAHVAGAAALYLAGGAVDLNDDGWVDTADARLMLLLAAEDVGDPGTDEVFGRGVVNAASASTAGYSEVAVYRATVRGTTVTITGQGFGGFSPEAITSVEGTIQAAEAGELVTVDGSIVLWSPGEIVADFPDPPREVLVRSVFGVAAAAVRPIGDGARFRRGDANADEVVDIADAIHTLEFLFLGREPPICPDASDGDDSGVLDLSDAVLILDWLFLGRGELPLPGATSCGTDPTRDPLAPCESEAVGC